MATLTADQVRALDPYAFLAVLGKRVIHPGGRRSTDRLLEWAAVRPGEQVGNIGCGVATTAPRLTRETDADAGLEGVRTETGPFDMMTPRGFLADEGAHCVAVMARGMTRTVYLRKMMWLMPRMARAVPYLGYVLVMAHRPAVDRKDPA